MKQGLFVALLQFCHLDSRFWNVHIRSTKNKNLSSLKMLDDKFPEILQVIKEAEPPYHNVSRIVARPANLEHEL